MKIYFWKNKTFQFTEGYIETKNLPGFTFIARMIYLLQYFYLSFIYSMDIITWNYVIIPELYM